jgi:tetratricopeptide (TPR) repeat protein
MKNLTKFSVITVIGAVIGLVLIGCAVSVSVSASWNLSKQQGTYVGLISFAGDAIDLNNNSVVYLDAAGSDTLLNKMNSQYVKETKSGTALFYAVHKALANLTANEKNIPKDVYSINILTFTDGLDNGSFGASNNKPIEGMKSVASNDYAAYVKEQIGSRTINGKPITAYSIGVRGSDVQDEAKFNENLTNIASNSANVNALTDFNQLQAVFDKIANELDVSHSSTAFAMITTMNDPGTIVRMTFDVSGSTSADADTSKRYIDGTLAYENDRWTLANVQYSPGIESGSGTAIPGTVSGSEITFTFSDITGYNPDKDTAKQWFKAPGSTSWQINSEYSSGGATATVVEKRTSLIYLVLDRSSSLSDDQVTVIRNAVSQFIKVLYNRSNGITADNYIERAKTYHANKDWDGQIAFCTEAINQFPSTSSFYVYRGEAYRMKNQYDDAIKNCTEAIRLNPNDSWAYYTRGLSYQLKKQYDAAIKDYTEVIRLNPNDISAYTLRGEAYLMKKQYDAAIKDYTEAIRLDPNSSLAYSNRGGAYDQAGDKNKAIQDLEKAISLNPSNNFFKDRLKEIRGY